MKKSVNITQSLAREDSESSCRAIFTATLEHLAINERYPRYRMSKIPTMGKLGWYREAYAFAPMYVMFSLPGRKRFLITIITL